MLSAQVLYSKRGTYKCQSSVLSLGVWIKTLPLLLLLSGQVVIPLNTSNRELLCMLQESMLLVHGLKLPKTEV